MKANTAKPTMNANIKPSPHKKPEIIISPIYRLSTNLIDYRQFGAESKEIF